LKEEEEGDSDGIIQAEPSEWRENIPSPFASLFQDLPPKSVLLLNMVAVLWGSQHAVIKTVVQDSDAGAFTLLRFGLAALIAAPYTPGLSSFWKNESKDDEDIETIWRWGAEMGFWMFLGFSFQAIGLEFTTAQKSGFLLYLNVKFVPFLARILFGRDISLPTWLSAITAFTGTALLAYGGGSNDASFALNVGDAWSIAAAVASAMFILRLESASAEVTNSAALSAACLWVVTLLAGLWTFFQNDFLGSSTYDANAFDQVVSIATSHPVEVLYLSGVTTALANWIQTKAQRDVSAERASVIYAMDPVYGAAFSSWLLGESLGGLQGWTGAGLITLAAATNAFLDLSNNSDEKDASKGSKSNGKI